MRDDRGTPSDGSAWPVDIAEEKAALGVCLWGKAKEVVRLLTADDFSVSAHRDIFAAICGLIDQGESVIEVCLLAGELRRRGRLDAIGGVAYLSDLDHGILLEREVTSRVRVLRELAERRHVLRVAKATMRRALDLTQPIAETKAWVQESLR